MTKFNGVTNAFFASDILFEWPHIILYSGKAASYEKFSHILTLEVPIVWKISRFNAVPIVWKISCFNAIDGSI